MVLQMVRGCFWMAGWLAVVWWCWARSRVILLLDLIINLWQAETGWFPRPSSSYKMLICRSGTSCFAAEQDWWVGLSRRLSFLRCTPCGFPRGDPHEEPNIVGHLFLVYLSSSRHALAAVPFVRGRVADYLPTNPLQIPPYVLVGCNSIRTT